MTARRFLIVVAGLAVIAAGCTFTPDPTPPAPVDATPVYTPTPLPPGGPLPPPTTSPSCAPLPDGHVEPHFVLINMGLDPEVHLDVQQAPGCEWQSFGEIAGVVPDGGNEPAWDSVNQFLIDDRTSPGYLITPHSSWRVTNPMGVVLGFFTLGDGSTTETISMFNDHPVMIGG